jgi:ribosomal protein S18 acetylase RimI-like enzyme
MQGGAHLKSKSAQKKGAVEERPVVEIRRARPADLPIIVALDERITKIPKKAYWKDLFDRFAIRSDNRAILVAEVEGKVVGFIIGEVRAWEFGEPPCGWIFGVNIEPDYREHGIASTLFEKLLAFFRECGVSKVRTLARRDESIVPVLSFFRSHGLTAGPFVELEREIDE